MGSRTTGTARGRRVLIGIAGGLLAAAAVPAEEEGARVLARSPSGSVLTFDAVVAYVEALQFSLGQVGEPLLGEVQIAQGVERLIAVYPGLPWAQQRALAGARQTWERTARSWPRLGAGDRAAFVYDLLAFTYGDAEAQRAVYGPSGGGGGSGGQYVDSSGDGSIASDGRCVYASIPGMSASLCD